MKHNQRYFTLIGIALLFIVVLIFLVSPGLMFSPTVTVIGSDLNKASVNQVSVITKTDLGNAEQLSKLPYEIGKWTGSDYDTTSTAKELGANVVLLRGYEPNTFTQPLFLTIVQSKTDSSFHRPQSCFNFQNGQIEESTDSLIVNNPGWIKGSSNISIPLIKLIVTRVAANGNQTERSLVLFFYAKGNEFYSDQITMIEAQGLIPLTGSYEDTLNEEKSLLSQVIPLLFQPNYQTEWKPLVISLTEKGTLGFASIILMLIIPVAIICYPAIRRRWGS